jgi:hypothetical protein
MPLSIDTLRLLLEVAVIAVTAVFSIKIGLDGIRKDIQAMSANVEDLKVSLREAAAQRANLDIRLTIVEADVKHISQTLSRMEQL